MTKVFRIKKVELLATGYCLHGRPAELTVLHNRFVTRNVTKTVFEKGTGKCMNKKELRRLD